jgi:transposase
VPQETAYALQQLILVLYCKQSCTPKEISKRLDTSLSTVYASLKNYNTYGTPHGPLVQSQGRKLILDDGHLHFICDSLSYNPFPYHDELQSLLHSEFGISVSISSISQAIPKLNFSQVRITKVAAERNDLLRLRFKDHAGHIIEHLDQVCFSMKVLKIKRPGGHYGHTKKGSCCMLPLPFMCQEQFALFAVSVTGIMVAEVYDGAVNLDHFLVFLQDNVVSTIAVPVLTHIIQC